MTYCCHFDLSSPNCTSSACRSCWVACGTRERFVTALPGASLKRTKLIVTATKTVTIANPTRFRTKPAPRTRKPLLLVHLRQPLDIQFVERPLRRVLEVDPVRRDRCHRVVVGEPEVRPLLVQHRLHRPDDLATLRFTRSHLLICVHLVVGLVAVARVAPTAVLVARNH